MTIKLKDLEKIVKDYKAAFEGWIVLECDKLIRESGPVLQGVLFNQASSHVYRPTGYIRILAAPGPKDALELARPLSYPNGAPGRSVTLSQHLRERDNIVASLREQIKPLVDQPLMPHDVLRLYETEAIPTEVETISLAALNAYLENEARARYWCSRYRDLVRIHESFEPLNGYGLSRLTFMNKLEEWLDKKVAHIRLQDIVQSERDKLGLK